MPSKRALNKHRFDNIIPQSFGSRINFMIELFNNFSMEVAKRKNKSFAYFTTKHMAFS